VLIKTRRGTENLAPPGNKFIRRWNSNTRTCLLGNQQCRHGIPAIEVLFVVKIGYAFRHANDTDGSGTNPAVLDSSVVKCPQLIEIDVK